MTTPRPMSTPIFDELLREFASRMDDQRGAQPDQADQAAPAHAAAPATPAGPPTHRHRAE